MVYTLDYYKKNFSRKKKWITYLALEAASWRGVNCHKSMALTLAPCYKIIIPCFFQNVGTRTCNSINFKQADIISSCWMNEQMNKHKQKKIYWINRNLKCYEVFSSNLPMGKLVVGSNTSELTKYPFTVQASKEGELKTLPLALW